MCLEYQLMFSRYKEMNILQLILVLGYDDDGPPETSNSTQELTFTCTYHGQLNFKSYLHNHFILLPFYSEPWSYLGRYAEKNYYTRIAD